MRCSLTGGQMPAAGIKKPVSGAVPCFNGAARRSLAQGAFSCLCIPGAKPRSIARASSHALEPATCGTFSIKNHVGRERDQHRERTAERSPLTFDALAGHREILTGRPAARHCADRY